MTDATKINTSCIQIAIDLTKNVKYHNRTKHIDFR